MSCTTGESYADDLSSDGIIYHYPRTHRTGVRDASEIEATKAAGRLGLPVFVVSYPSPGSSLRDVALGWVEGWDERAQMFLISFRDDEPALLLDSDRVDEEPFDLEGSGTRVRGSSMARTGQSKFRFQVLQRYGANCAVSGIAVPEMLEAVHLRDVADGGSNDARNGLVLSAAHHRAFDAGLFAINAQFSVERPLDINHSGASLAATTRLAAEKGYRLVGVHRHGFNAFYVHESAGSFPPAVSVESCSHQPKTVRERPTRLPLMEQLVWLDV